MRRHLILLLLATTSPAWCEAKKSLRVALSDRQPEFSELQVDSLATGKFPGNPVVSGQKQGENWTLRTNGRNSSAYSAEVDGRAQDLWTVETGDRKVILRSVYHEGAPSVDFTLRIDQKLNHATLLALPLAEAGRMAMPAVLHLPDQGSFRITGTGPFLNYQARRRQRGNPANWVHVGFPAATRDRPEVEYVLQVAAIHPALPGLAGTPLYEGYRRNFLNIFQWHPRLRTLANNSSSDVCGFVLYQYAEAAARAPDLAPGLRAMDLIRLSVDRVLDGGLVYGQVGYRSTAIYPEAAPWNGPNESLDHAPSILWAACRYALVTGDREWAEARFSRLAALAYRMLARDRDGDGLIEYEASGNSGSWPGKKTLRPANWWDTVGFGHEDAYSNALAHRALRLLAELSVLLDRNDDEERFTIAAERLKSSYSRELFNPKTGLIAGWKSADGELHDYAFTFVNGLAVSLGLIEGSEARQLMQTLLARMKKEGYDRFDLGLPGNLVPVRKADYVDHDPKYGGGVKEDGSDGFQTYINGGATACHVYWMVKALYQSGLKEDARRIFHPMLGSFAAGSFQGMDPTGKSLDWKNWRGEAKGYEGYLVDGYLALIAVEDDLAAGR